MPHCFVFHRGRVGKNVQQLILDVRRVMEPYTATTLKVKLWGITGPWQELIATVILRSQNERKPVQDKSIIRN